MKVVITKKEDKEIRPRYREKYSNETVEIMRKRAIQDKANKEKSYRLARYENNNYVYQGK
jgi:hypothetical protein